jgi:hypothetical protein
VPLKGACKGLGLFLGLTALSLTIVASSAVAQSANERSLARSQFRDGLEAAQGGDWSSAYESFQSSYALVQRPVTLLNLAGAMVQTGRLVEGAEGYRGFLRRARTGRAAAHRPAARAALEELEGRIPVVELRVMGFEPDDVLSLDGWEVSREVLDRELPVDPGEHLVTVDRDGHEPLVVTFEIGERSTREVVVDATPEHWRSIGAENSTEVNLLVDPNANETHVEDDGGGSVFSSPWFWIIVGVVIAGGVTAAVIAATSGGNERATVMGNLPPFRVEID